MLDQFMMHDGEVQALREPRRDIVAEGGHLAGHGNDSHRFLQSEASPGSAMDGRSASPTRPPRKAAADAAARRPAVAARQMPGNEHQHAAYATEMVAPCGSVNKGLCVQRITCRLGGWYGGDR